MTAATACRTCGTEPHEGTRSCHAAVTSDRIVLLAPRLDHRLPPVLNQDGAAPVSPLEGW
jgi:hypothetical protein